MSETVEINITEIHSQSNTLPIFSAYFEYGRHALFEILRLNKIGKGDKVLIPDFICLEVLGSISAIGAEIKYYSVSEDLKARDLPIDNSIKAVIAVNYFGFPQDLSIFKKYCFENKVILIEDNAHGFLSKDTEGKWLGTRSDFGLFSLRKTFFTIDGGAIWIKNRTQFSEIQILEPQILKTPLRIRCKEILNRIQVKTGIPIGLALDSGFRYLRHLRTGHYFPQVNNEFEKLMPAVAPLHLHILQKIQKTDINLEGKRRRKLYYKIKKILSEIGIFPIFDELEEGTVPYGFPFRASTKELWIVSKKVARLGLYPVKWPDLPSNVVFSSPEYYKNVYLINFI